VSVDAPSIHVSYEPSDSLGVSVLYDPQSIGGTSLVVEFDDATGNKLVYEVASSRPPAPSPDVLPEVTAVTVLEAGKPKR
jgi:hypothetical protein